MKPIPQIILCLSVLVLVGCAQQSPLRQGGLDFEKSVFAKVDEAGKIQILEKPEYERGETVHFALMKVGKFKKGDDGKHQVEMDLKVRDTKGKKIFEKKGVLGEGGHTELKDDTAESPTGIFPHTASVEKGNYSIQVIVYDKIGGGKAGDEGAFTLK